MWTCSVELPEAVSPLICVADRINQGLFYSTYMLRYESFEYCAVCRGSKGSCLRTSCLPLGRTKGR